MLAPRHLKIIFAINRRCLSRAPNSQSGAECKPIGRTPGLRSPNLGAAEATIGIPVDIVATLRDAVANIHLSTDSPANDAILSRASASNRAVTMPPSADQGQCVPEPDDQYERKA
jgi:hypothetical protein